MLKQRICTCKNMGNKFVVRRGLNEFCIHHAIKQNLSRAIGTRATNEAGLQMGRHRILGVPFIALFLNRFSLVLLNKARKSTYGFIWKAKLLRQIFIKPHTLLLFRCSSRVFAQQIHNKRTILSADFQLQIFQVIADAFQVGHREIEESVVLEELVFFIFLR